MLNGTSTPLSATAAQFIVTASGGDTLTWPLFDLPPNARLTITYDAVLVNNAPAGATLDSDVSASYHSLVAGGTAGRDNLDTGDDDAANQSAPLNNYGESGSVSLTLDAALAIQKTLNAIHADNTFTIGDEIVFDLRVDMVEGEIDHLVISDVLPAGIQFLGFEAITATSNISHHYVGPPSQSGPNVDFDLGTVTNTADANNANDYLVLSLRARVTDVSGNIDDTTLTNSASVTSSSGNAGPVTREIHIVEPQLALTKTPDDPSPSLGDRVTWTIEARNQSDAAAAFDVVLSDLIPPGLTYVAGSTSGATANESNSAQPQFSFASIAPSELKTFSFQTRVDENATVGVAITNGIGAAYDGQSGTPTVQRDYIDSTNGQVTPDTDAFIEAEKTVTLATDNLTPGIVDPGDTLLYTVVLSNTGTTANHVLFTDTVPVGSTYVQGSLSTTSGTPNASAARTSALT